MSHLPRAKVMGRCVQELFKEIPESDFRNDVSSTQLREGETG